MLNEVFPSKYIKAADLQGREVHVVIAEVTVEKMGDDRKLVMYFQGKEKGLVTNKTNANRVATLYGEDTDQWIGKEILLGTDFVDFQGRTVEAIRVKPPTRRTPTPQQGRQFADRKISGGGTIMDAEPMDGLEEVVGRTSSQNTQRGPDF